MGSSRVDLLKNIALSLVSTLVLLFLIEMVLRVTEVVPVRTLEYATPALWNVNPGPLFPGQSFTDRFKRSLPFRVTVDNLGFRGVKNIQFQKAPGTLRVLCLGDSYTFGAYVDDGETWPAQLETILREDRPERPVEVINAGISGFTILDELQFFKEHGESLKPDVVVVGFVLNDLADLTRRVSSREMLKIASVEGSRPPLGPVKARLRQTAIYNAMFMMKAWLRKTTGNDPTIQEVDIRHLLKPVYDQETLDLFDRYRGHLAELKSILDRDGTPLVLMIFPYWEQVSRNATDQAQQRLIAMAKELNIPTLDLLPSYRQYDPRGRKFFHMPWDHHPSARGYRRAARELAATVEPLLFVDTRPAGARPAGAAAPAH
ncbi:MAG TPA: SGNH/GDSL hydrolase family protein [Patescibacteria group bacterium]|nr:SGNH/GDSL hydrolase family protein [Patescibacteria group bacterium]